MTKEQEKAIRYVNFMSKTIKFDKSGFPYGKESLETVLNMVKENDAEIEKYNKLLADNLAKDLNNSIKAKHKADTDLEDLNEGWKLELKKKEEELEMYKDMKEIVDYKVTDLLKLKQYDDLKKKVAKQDKMIDLILEFLSKIDLGYYTKEEGGEIQGIFRKYNKDDWKQYFERKEEKC